MQDQFSLVLFHQMCMVQLRYIFDSNCTVEYGCNCIINIRIERKSRAHVFQLYINSIRLLIAVMVCIIQL